jgi:flagella basal body P-ring formation protein FlgA
MKPWHLLLSSAACGALALALASAPRPALGAEPAPPAPLVVATAAPVPPGPANVGEEVRRFVAAEVARSQPGLRAEITVGDIDSRLRLAACDRTEVFLHAGARLWGRSFVGYRCLQRPGWSISVPVTVRLFGPALVAAQSLPALQTISASAVRREEVEVTREPGGVVNDAAQLEDQVCTRSLEPGQPIPLNALRAVPAVGQGDSVKLVGVGNGFSISTDGIALATAAAGESVRVRVESGRTVSGVARKGRIVEVGF